MCAFILNLVRHGETPENRLKIIQGHKNTILTDKGREQARLLGLKLKNIRFQKIFSSDLIRALETCQIIVSQNEESSHCPITIDERLRERCLGTLEGQSLSHCKNKFNKHTDKSTPSDTDKSTPSGVETIQQLKNRAKLFFQHLCKELKEEFCNEYKSDSLNFHNNFNNNFLHGSHNETPFNISYNYLNETCDLSNTPEKDNISIDKIKLEQSDPGNTIGNKYIATNLKFAENLDEIINLKDNIKPELKSENKLPHKNKSNIVQILIISHGGFLLELCNYFFKELKCLRSKLNSKDINSLELDTDYINQLVQETNLSDKFNSSETMLNFGESYLITNNHLINDKFISSKKSFIGLLSNSGLSRFLVIFKLPIKNLSSLKNKVTTSLSLCKINNHLIEPNPGISIKSFKVYSQNLNDVHLAKGSNNSLKHSFEEDSKNANCIPGLNYKDKANNLIFEKNFNNNFIKSTSEIDNPIYNLYTSETDNISTNTQESLKIHQSDYDNFGNGNNVNIKHVSPVLLNSCSSNSMTNLKKLTKNTKFQSGSYSKQIDESHILKKSSDNSCKSVHNIHKSLIIISLSLNNIDHLKDLSDKFGEEADILATRNTQIYPDKSKDTDIKEEINIDYYVIA